LWFVLLSASFVPSKTFSKGVSLPLLPHCLFVTLHRLHSAFCSALLFRVGSWFVLKLPQSPEVAVLDLL
jgi:hypothetical protein